MASLTAEHYTRAGQVGEYRGESMVQKHRDKLQKEKEAEVLEALRTTFPLLPVSVLRLASQEVGWEADLAAKLLTQFQSAAKPQLARLVEQYGAVPAPRTQSGSESDASEDKGRHRSSKGKRKREKEHKHKKSRKRSSKEHEADGGLALTQQYGKYGIIRETDMRDKHSEFALWAKDVKKIDVEAMPKKEEQELFKDYMEDYNTGTLPHKKYYDREAYEAARAAKAAKKGIAVDAEKTAFNDEEELKRQLAAKRAEEAAERMRDAYNELKYTARDKMGDMREQELMRMQMGLAYRTGDHTTATKLAERLKPDDQKDPHRPDEGLKPL